MKLIIDIPDDVYTRLFDNGIQDNEIAIDDICEMARAIRKGIPLDKIRVEIERKYQRAKEYNSVLQMNAYMDCLQIIDKYRGENE